MAGSLFKELKRRNVFRVAAIYVVVSWLLLQIGDVLFPALRLPEWSSTLLVAFLILGLPIALIFAWAFELTPDGVIRTEDVPREQSITGATGQKINHLIIGVLTVAVVFLLLRMFVFQEHDVERFVDANERSIAVLPFKNQSASEENAEFFSGGLHDELLTLLSRIGDLKVISRTSVERLDPNLSIPEIGSLLGVATVLEGQVQRAGNRLRINVQLINTAEEGHLWANTYDSELTAENVFEVQGDIARTIADALHAELSPDEERVLDSVGTKNLEALDAYLVGVQIAKRNTYAALAEAEQYLAGATELDPGFAEAWAELADVYSNQVFTGLITNDEYRENARLPVLRALEIDPALPRAHAQHGFFKWFSGDIAGAENSFRQALRLNPADTRSLEKYGLFLRASGRLEEAIGVLRTALEQDPLSTEILFQIGKVEMRAGRPERFIELAERIVEIDPASIHGYLGGMQGSVWMGRYDTAWPWYIKALAVDKGDYENWAFFAATNDTLGARELADRYMERAEAIGPGQPAVLMCKVIILTTRGAEDDAHAIAKAAQEAGVAARWGSDKVLLRAIRDRGLRTGEFDEALAWYRKLYPELFESPVEADGRNFYIAPDLALLLQRSGQPELANRILASTLEWYENNVPDGVYGYDFGIIKVELLVLLGRKDAAVAELQRAADAGWRHMWRYNINSANLDAIRDAPEFQAILDRLEADMAAQYEAVRALPYLGETDLRNLATN